MALLLERWDADAGVLRSSPSEAQRRVLDGELHLVVQFNPSHAQKKRPVDQQLLRPPPASPALPPPSAFNFTKIRRNELLCAMYFEDAVSDKWPQLVQVHAVDDESREELPTHAVLVNVSPLMRGHSLFVLDLPQVKPQKLEHQYLRNGASIVHAAQDPHFSLGFNSVGAWSSVNHFHLQGFFTSEISSGLAFPVLKQSRQELFAYGAAVVFEFPHWPMRCFGISAINTSDDWTSIESFAAVVEVAWTLLSLLQSRNIPHNVLIASDEATSQPLVIVFPRQHQRENGVGLFAKEEGGDGASASGPGLRFAIAELSGLVIANSSITFQHFTQETFVQILSNEISITKVTICVRNLSS
ncbi:hypothetical protein Gpo141_00007383 [Globisporangium polare]